MEIKQTDKFAGLRKLELGKQELQKVRGGFNFMGFMSQITFMVQDEIRCNFDRSVSFFFRTGNGDGDW